MPFPVKSRRQGKADNATQIIVTDKRKQKEVATKIPKMFGIYAN